MRLYYFRGEDGVRNFGDELNVHLWPRLLQGAFDEDEGTQFVGIGTVLNDRLPPARRTVVFGAGVGYYGPPRRDETWTIYCVRGPLSAEALGLSRASAITDPAVLVARAVSARAVRPHLRCAFMPHWQSQPDDWKQVCDRAGIAFIDPRWTPGAVLEALRGTRTLITEAMHGAIVADALRVPWTAVRTRGAINGFKWHDWCRSMSLEYQPVTLPSIWPRRAGAGLVGGVRRSAKLLLAARALARVARDGCAMLSDDALLEERLQQLEERLDDLRRAECLRPAAQTICTTAPSGSLM